MTALAHLHIEAENGPLSNECVDRGIISFLSFIEWVEQLPYARNSDRSDYTLVLEEECGTCSTKNALVKAVANENGWDHVKLFLGRYSMSPKTNPPIAAILTKNNLSHIPEAHVYLKINGDIRDVTGLELGLEPFHATLQSEIEIQPKQIGNFKEEWHHAALDKFARQQNKTVDSIWAIRETCINALSQE